MFYNIHTHHTPAAGQWAIVNLLQDFDAIPATGLYSAGLHPWYLNKETADTALQQLNLSLQKNNVLAVGECGLDKVCKTDYGLQLEYFRQQVLLANQHGKPLVLHCVKAFDDTLRILKEAAVAVPVIFHGYHKSAELAAQLVKAGYYLSFGKHIMQAATAAVFHSIPLNHIFLETDAAEMEIEALYAEAAVIKHISITGLEEQVAANAVKLFGNITLKYNGG
jgi:TatD DNase family protein